MFQFTLKSARISCGYSEEEIAQKCDIEASYYSVIESDPGSAPYNLLNTILIVLGVPAELIYLGPDEKCIKKNRERVA